MEGDGDRSQLRKTRALASTNAWGDGGKEMDWTERGKEVYESERDDGGLTRGLSTMSGEQVPSRLTGTRRVVLRRRIVVVRGRLAPAPKGGVDSEN